MWSTLSTHLLEIDFGEMSFHCNRFLLLLIAKSQLGQPWVPEKMRQFNLSGRVLRMKQVSKEENSLRLVSVLETTKHSQVTVLRVVCGQLASLEGIKHHLRLKLALKWLNFISICHFNWHKSPRRKFFFLMIARQKEASNVCNWTKQQKNPSAVKFDGEIPAGRCLAGVSKVKVSSVIFFFFLRCYYCSDYRC